MQMFKRKWCRPDLVAWQCWGLGLFLSCCSVILKSQLLSLEPRWPLQLLLADIRCGAGQGRQEAMLETLLLPFQGCSLPVPIASAGEFTGQNLIQLRLAPLQLGGLHLSSHNQLKLEVENGDRGNRQESRSQMVLGAKFVNRRQIMNILNWLNNYSNPSDGIRCSYI